MGPALPCSGRRSGERELHLTKLLSFQHKQLSLGQEGFGGRVGWQITAACQARVTTAQQSSQIRAFSWFPSSHLPLSLPLHGKWERVNPVTFNQGLVYVEKD